MDFDSLPDDSAQPATAPVQPHAISTPASAMPDFDSLQDDNQQYEGAGHTVAAGALGVAQGVLGPVAPLIEKHILGIPKEYIKGSQEAHPVASGIGEGVGLIGGALTGTGVGAGLEAVGAGADIATHAPEAISYAHKVGSAAVKGAAEMAALQGSDEAAKMVISDQNADDAAQTAIGNIGLAAALGAGGGAFMKGAVSPLWSATIGPKVEGALTALTDRFGGIEQGAVDKAAAQKTSQQLESDSGIALPNDIKNVLDGTPMAQTTHSVLSQSDNTFTGRAYQKQLQEVEDQAAGKVISSLGRNPSSLESMPELDKYSSGRDIGETLKSEFEAQAKPISARYDAINEEFKNSPISYNNRNLIADQIANASMEQGWHKAADDASVKLVQKVMDKLPEQETISDLKQFITNLRQSHPYGSDTYQAAKTMANALNTGLESSVAENLGAKAGADKVAEYSQLRGDYKNLMSQAEALNEHLHVGKYNGPQSFAQAIGEMSSASGENVLNRLSGKNRADILEQLKSYPQTLDKVKNYHIDNLLDQAVRKAPAGKNINMNKLLSGIESSSPQIKELIASPEQHKTIQAASKIMEGLKDPTHNFSNTARTVAKLTHGTPSALSLIAALTGHGEVGIASYIGGIAGGELKDGARLALTRLMSSDQPVNAAGFKAAISFANATIKGEKIMDKSVSNIFKAGSSNILTSSQLPSHAELMHLDKMVASNAQNPESQLHQQDSQLGHYMPQHQVAATAVTQQAQQYLNTIKPKPYQPSPLDKPIQPTPAEQARYERALTIAQQPNVIMQHIKDGTILPSDIQDLHNMYPALYKRMAMKITNQMQSQQSEDEQIPYRTRMGLSLFLGQPVETSMQPASIQAAQPMPQQPPMQPQGKPMKGRKGTSSLGKSAKESMTPTQSAESDRSNRD